MYLPGGLEAEVRAGVKAQKTAGVGLGVPLSLIGALPALRRVRNLVIWLDWVRKYL